MTDGDISAAVDRAAGETTAPANPATSDTSPGSIGAPASGAPADATADRSGPERQPRQPRQARATDDTGPRLPGTPETLEAGAPPADRWSTVLENARTDTRNKIHEEYGIGEKYSPEVVKGFGKMLQTFPDIDPRAVVVHATMLRVNPVEYHRQLTDQLARQGLLGNGAQPEPDRGDARSRPEPSYRTPDGTPFYSGPDIEAYFDYMTDDIIRRVEGRLQPIESERMEAQAADYARSQIDEMKSWPHFAEIREDMGRLMLADPRLSLEGAYIRLFREKFKNHDSQVRQETRSKTLEELRTAPDPNTPRPGRPTPSMAGRKTRGQSLDSRIDQAFEKAVHTVSG